VRFTEGKGDGRRIAREETTAGRGLIVAMGGDGTISEVADAFSPQEAPPSWESFRAAPVADFRRSLEIDDDLGRVARRIRETPARLIDAGRVSFVADDGSQAERHFVNVVSFGFSSDVARQANTSSKRLGGRVAFLSATVRSLVSYDNVDVVLSVDDQPERRMSLLLAAVGNGRFFGGGMKICPEAVLDDGLFDLVTVGNLGRVGVMANIHRIYSGHHLTMKEVQGHAGPSHEGHAGRPRSEDSTRGRWRNPGPPACQLRASARRSTRTRVMSFFLMAFGPAGALTPQRR